MGLPWQTSEVSSLACFTLRGSPALSPRAGAFLLNFMISGALASRAFLLESLTRALETAVGVRRYPSNAQIRSGVQPTYLILLFSLWLCLSRPWWRSGKQFCRCWLLSVVSPMLVMDGDGMEWPPGSLDPAEAILTFVFPELLVHFFSYVQSATLLSWGIDYSAA